MNKLTITRPDDWHLHLRDDAAMAAVLPHTAAQFARAIIMPNLQTPITITAQALAYRERILAARPAGNSFQPLMTLYLTDSTLADEIWRAKESGVVFAVKLYPAGATTNSDSGVTDLRHCENTLRAMAAAQIPLLVHGEVTDNDVDIFDRERVFLERVLAPLLARIPDLKVVVEHITTAEAAKFVLESGSKIGATITPQHLLLNRNALLAGGIRPHNYCLPVLKRETHRQALLEIATSGHARFFLGTDSAPHARNTKEHACGCAGIYSAHAAIELYAEAFASVDKLDRLEAFASYHGADFYGLPRDQDSITLHKENWLVPSSYAFADDVVVPLRATENISWKLHD
ncbi:MAG: dihydroorotase [Thiohalomonadaceae bacterium]